MYAIDHRDLGTPASAEPGEVTLEIDGRAVTVPSGTSIMRAAALAGTGIPKLCATDSLESFGSCRMRLVEIEGRRGFPASCTTTVAPGMKVRTETPRPRTLSRGVLDLYLSDHPLDCDTCPADGHCELQSVSSQLGVTESRPAAVGEGIRRDVEHAHHIRAGVQARRWERGGRHLRPRARPSGPRQAAVLQFVTVDDDEAAPLFGGAAVVSITARRARTR